MNRLPTCATLLLAGALVANATPASDARASLAQLRRAITNRDGQLLTQLLGSSHFRAPGTTQIRWNDVDDYVRSAEAVVASPVRTVSGQTSVGQPQFAIIGWAGNTLRAARFLKDDQNRWLLAKLHLGATARTTADRQAFERHVRQVPEQRLADAFFRGNITTLGTLVTELEELREAPPSRADSLDQLLERYRRVWHDHACNDIATVYDPRATWTDATNNLAFTYTTLQQFCVKSGQYRPELSLQLLEQKTTADGITARIRTVNTTSGWSWETTLAIINTGGKYRINREEHMNHRPRNG